MERNSYTAQSKRKRCEAFVRDVLTNVLRQKVSSATIRAVALKVAKALP